MIDQEFIPFFKPDVGDMEVDAVSQAIRSGWLTSGPVMRAFEEDFVEYMGGGIEAVSINSATAGLHLALEAVGVGPGDEVIVPTWTFTSTAEVVRYLGATPIIVDIDRDTMNVSPIAVGEAITDRTRAIIPVHFAGLAVDLKEIWSQIGNRSIAIIEDAAHALPTIGPDDLVGSCTNSDVAVFSFYATKTMTTGEGGMLTTRNPDVARRARIMRLHGIDRDAFDRYTSTKPSWSYDVVAPGFKYNMPDIAAAMGRVQLHRSDEMHKRRRAIADYYLSELRGLPIKLPATANTSETHAWHLFVIQLHDDSFVSRNDFIERMASAGVGTSVHFIPLHEHSYWKKFVTSPNELLPKACSISNKVVSLPLFSTMTDTMIERVVQATKDTLK